MKVLDNAQWGFESNCFVCERANPQGLRVPFAHDEARHVVVATFSLGPEFSGAPNFVHGGIVSAILDEAMAWAAIAIGGAFAVTSELSVRFERPVRVDRSYRVEAALLDTDTTAIHAEASIVDAKDRVCATATSTLVPLNATQAADATGTEVVGADGAFLRPTRT
ncbi:MAG: PaaI family thioesterase [Actinobacteria bacterium]|nr:PaaI family thioesterase [Actinomycetota bacterium]